MGPEIGEAVIKIGADARGVSRDLNKQAGEMGGGLRGAAGKVGMLFGGFLMAGIATGLAGIGAVVSEGLKESIVAQNLNAQFAAGIKSTGNQAHLSVKGMDDLAASVAGYSGQSFASIGASEKLLQTFVSIKNTKTDKIFDQATAAVADMAAKMGGPGKKYAMQLGKALNDPVKGMTALGRSGVQFTASQKATITSMQKSGNIMGAQKIILKELQTEFGGAAKAAGNTLTGSLARVHVAFGEISKTVMEGVLPVVTPLISGIATALVKAMPMVERFTEEIKKFFHEITQSAVFKEVVGGIRAFAAAFMAGGNDVTSSGFAGILERIGLAVRKVWDTITAVVKDLKAGNLGGAFADVSKGVSAAIPAIGKAISSAIPIIGTAIQNIAMKFLNWITPLIVPMLVKLAGFWLQVETWIWGTGLPALVKALKGWAEALVGWATKALPPLLTQLGTMLGALGTWILNVGLGLLVHKLGEWGLAFVKWVVPVLGPLLIEVSKLAAKLTWWIVSQALPAIISKLASWGLAFLKWVRPASIQLLGALGGLLVKLGQWIWNTALPAIGAKLAGWGKAFVDWVKAAAAKLPGQLGNLLSIIGTWASGIAGKIAAWLGDLFAPLASKGSKAGGDFITSFITPIWKGITDFFSSVMTWVTTTWNNIVTWLSTTGVSILNAITLPWRLGVAVMIGVANIIVSAVWPPIKGFIDRVVQGWINIWNSAVSIFNTVKAFLIGVWNTIYGVVAPIVAKMILSITTVFTRAWNFTVSIFTSVKNFLTTTWNTIYVTVSGIVTRAVGFVTGRFNDLKNILSGVWNTVTSRVSSAWNTIWSTVSGIANRIWSTVSTAFGNVVTAISNAAGSAKTAATNLVSTIVTAISNKIGEIQTMGGNLVQGFINGFTSIAGQLSGAVTKFITDNVPLPIRKVLGLASPSKLTQQFGRWVGLGFIKGIKGTQAQALAQARALAGVIGTALTDARTKLSDVLTAKSDFAKGVRDAVVAFGSVVGVQATGKDGVLTSGDITTQLKTRLLAVQTFYANLATLKSRGLNKTAYQQLIDAGVDSAGDSATALVKGGTAVVGQVNSLQAQIAKAGGALGQTTSGVLFKAGVDAAQGLVNGIASKAKALAHSASALGKALVAEIKRTLGIKSPSKVTEALGVNISQGLVKGILGQRAAVSAAVGGMVALPSSGNLSGASGANGGATTISIAMTVKVDDLAQMTKVADFIKMLDNARVDRRRTERSGAVTA